MHEPGSANNRPLPCHDRFVIALFKLPSQDPNIHQKSQISLTYSNATYVIKSEKYQICANQVEPKHFQNSMTSLAPSSVAKFLIATNCVKLSTLTVELQHHDKLGEEIRTSQQVLVTAAENNKIVRVRRLRVSVCDGM